MTFRTLARRASAARSGVAVVEFAILGPMMALLAMTLSDFGLAYHMQMQLLTATAAGAQVAQSRGASITSSNYPSFVTSVRSAVIAAADLSRPPTVTIAVNGATDGSRVGSFACVNGKPQIWRTVASSTTVCGPDLLAGRFVTLSVSSEFTPLLPLDKVIGSAFPMTESITVRIR